MSSSIRSQVRNRIKQVASDMFNPWGSNSNVSDHIKEIITTNMREVVNPSEVVELAKEHLSGDKLKSLVNSYFSIHKDEMGRDLALQRVKQVLPNFRKLIDKKKVAEYAKAKLSGFFLQQLVGEAIEMEKERITAYIRTLIPDVADVLNEEMLRESVRLTLQERFSRYSLQSIFNRDEEISRNFDRYAKHAFSDLFPDLPHLIDSEFLTEEMKGQLKETVLQQLRYKVQSFAYSGLGQTMVRDQVLKILSPELKRQLTPELAREAIEKQLPDAVSQVVSTLLRNNGHRGYEEVMERLYPIITQVTVELMEEILQENDNES